MVEWNTVWNEVRSAVRGSKTTWEAAKKVSTLRGCETTWGAIKAAWARREKDAAWDNLGKPPEVLKQGVSAFAAHLVTPGPMSFTKRQGEIEDEQVALLKEVLKDPTPPVWYADIRLACASVWSQLGAGYQETFYSTALGVALQSQGHHVDREVSLGIEFHNRVVGVARADLLVSHTSGVYVVVEAKRIKNALSLADENQCRAYMRSLEKKGYGKVYGVLVNFPLYAGSLETKPVFESGALEDKK